jgi:hypothetical protein
MMPPPGPVEPREYEAAGPPGPVPTAFDALTNTEYLVPFVNPVIEHVRGLSAVATTVEHEAPPGDRVTVYPVTGEPPSVAGGNHEMVADPFPAVAEILPATPGAPIGVTAEVPALEGESPALFVATTVKVYEVPLLSPVQAAVTPVTTHAAPTGDDVTVYDVIAAPPLFTGAVHETEAEASPATALTAVGADGAAG